MKENSMRGSVASFSVRGVVPALAVAFLLAWAGAFARVSGWARRVPVLVPAVRLRRWGVASLALAGGLHALSGATAPSISSALDVQVQVNTPFAYRITINQAWPLDTFDASPLPPGLTVNKRFGYISGKPTQVGTNKVTIVASQGGLPDRTLSDVLTLRVTAGPTPPLFRTDPSDVVAIAGTQVTLSAEAVGTGDIQYQWYRGNMIFDRFFEGPAVDGATGPQLVLPAATDQDIGWYVVKARNAAGTATSRPAQVLLILPPQLYSQPGDATVHEGMPLSLYVGADGGAQLDVQWRHNGQPVPGATNLFYNVLRASPADAGTYDALLDNAAGHAVSEVAMVRVEAPLTPSMGRSATGAPVLRFNAIPGTFYTLYSADNPGGDWNYYGDVQPTGTNVVRTLGATGAQRYFRVGVN